MPAPDTSDREIVIRRTIAAPRALVFAAFTEARHIDAWFGPVGYTTTTQSMDVHPGGLWRYAMSGHGMSYATWVRYHQVDAPALLVYEVGTGSPDSPAHFQVRVTFSTVGAATELTMRSLFPSAAARNQVVDKHHAIEGGQQTLARLDSHLHDQALAAAPLPPLGTPFVFARIVAAPRAVVWNAWTDPTALLHWFGPKGCTLTAASLDLRPGGVFHYAMETPGGTMWGKWLFREVVAPERLVLIQCFSDATGGVTRHPFSPNWPLLTYSVLTLSEAAGQTTMTLAWSPWDGDDLARATFDSSHPDMERGWSGTFAALLQYLQSVTKDRSP